MTRKLVCISFAILAAASLSGCRHGDRSTLWLSESPRREVPVLGETLSGESPLAIDIDNQRGSVVVLVDDRLTEPVVTARTRWSTEDDGDERWRRSDPPSTILATNAGQDSGTGDMTPQILRITSMPQDDAPVDVFVDIKVRTPRCDGIGVRNSDGAVVLVGVGGAITVDNGFDFKPGGRIELRTNRALKDPVALVTTDGRISAILTEESRGELDLSTAEGEAIFTTRHAKLREVYQSHNNWRGGWNGGDNPIYARSGRGDVRFVIVDDPEMYSVADGIVDDMSH